MAGKSESGLAVGLVVAAFVLTTMYALVVPPWMGPDEPRHVEYVLIMAAKGRLVTWADQVPAIETAILRSMDRYRFWQFGLVTPEVYRPGTLPTRFNQVWAAGLSHELHQPPLYYIAQLPVALASQGMDVAVQSKLMRLLSALLSTATVALTWLTVREAFPGELWLAVGATALVGLLPMHAFIGGMVNNDVMAEVLGAAVIYLLVVGLSRGFSRPLVLAAVALSVLALLAKRSAVFAPLVLVWAFFLYLRRQRRLPSWRAGVLLAAAAGAGAWMVAWLLDRWQHWLPKLPGPVQSLLYVYVFFLLRPSSMHSYTVRLEEFTTQQAVAYYQRWLQMLLETFWARFGWVNVRLDENYYTLLAWVSIVAIAGAALVLVDAMRGKWPPTGRQRDVIALFAGAVAISFVVLLVKMVREWDAVPRPTTQARFLFPVLLPLAVLGVAGLARFVPRRLRPVLVGVLVVGLAVLNVICLVGYVIPFYRQ